MLWVLGLHCSATQPLGAAKVSFIRESTVKEVAGNDERGSAINAVNAT